MAYKKRLVTFPTGVGYKGTTDTNFYKAAKNYDTIMVRSDGNVYSSDFTVPKEGGGTHTLKSQGDGDVHNNGSGLFTRDNNNNTSTYYDVYTQRNQTSWNKTISVGAKYQSGQSMNDISSAWVHDCVGYWGMIAGFDNASAGDCSGQLNSIIGAYAKPNGGTAYIWYSVKKGDYSYGDKLRRGDTQKRFGYVASASDCTSIINGKWRLFRVYLELNVTKNGKSGSTDRCNVSVWSLTPQLGTNYTQWSGNHNIKKLLVPKVSKWASRWTSTSKVPFMHQI